MFKYYLISRLGETPQLVCIDYNSFLVYLSQLVYKLSPSSFSGWWTTAMFAVIWIDIVTFEYTDIKNNTFKYKNTLPPSLDHELQQLLLLVILVTHILVVIIAAIFNNQWPSPCVYWLHHSWIPWSPTLNLEYTDTIPALLVHELLQSLFSVAILAAILAIFPIIKVAAYTQFTLAHHVAPMHCNPLPVLSDNAT